MINPDFHEWKAVFLFWRGRGGYFLLYPHLHSATLRVAYINWCSFVCLLQKHSFGSCTAAQWPSSSENQCQRVSNRVRTRGEPLPEALNKTCHVGRRRLSGGGQIWGCQLNAEKRLSVALTSLSPLWLASLNIHARLSSQPRRRRADSPLLGSAEEASLPATEAQMM